MSSAVHTTDEDMMIKLLLSMGLSKEEIGKKLGRFGEELDKLMSDYRAKFQVNQNDGFEFQMDGDCGEMMKGFVDKAVERVFHPGLTREEFKRIKGL